MLFRQNTVHFCTKPKTSTSVKIKHCARTNDPKLHRAKNISLLKIEDNIISDHLMIVESFNVRFVNIGAKPANEIENNSTESVISRPVLNLI